MISVLLNLNCLFFCLRQHRKSLSYPWKKMLFLLTPYLKKKKKINYFYQFFFFFFNIFWGLSTFIAFPVFLVLYQVFPFML